MKAIILLILVIFSSCNLEIKESIIQKFISGSTKDLFKVYHLLYEKKYDLNTEEGIRRYKNFKENLRIINKVNSQNLSYKYGINQFADMSKEEFAEKYLMNPQVKRNIIAESMKDAANFRDFDEYVEENDFSPVDNSEWLLKPRDQGDCGSCWTFSMTATIEGARYRQTGVKEYLSTQQFLDCDKNNNGCDGGMFPGAIEYAKKNAILREQDYPYKGRVDICKPDTKKKGTKVSTHSYCSNYSRKYLCTNEKVYNFLKKGPVAVGIDGSTIQLYSSGIFDDACFEDNHAVVLVGYGVENGMKFWKIRNSWGENWGEKGHIRVALNDANLKSCYVANEAFTVDIAKS